MFRCHFCQQITPPKTTRHRIVVETRMKRYAIRRKEGKRRSFRDRDEPVQDRGGEGVEILREVDACPACAAKQQGLTPTPVPLETPAKPQPEEGERE